MKRKLLLPVIFAVLLLHSCSKEKLTHVGINSAIVKAFNYKIGSYWIYRDSLSGEIDSFYVTNNLLSESNNYINYVYDYINISISESQIYPLASPLATHHWTYLYEAKDFCLFDDDYTATDPLTFVPLINYPYRDTVYLTSDIADGGLPVSGFALDTFSDYFFNGQHYSNVAKINWTYVYSDTIRDCFYMSPDVGFFKMSIYQTKDSLNHVWEIQRYNIVH